jgi:hypothetical protein
MSARSQWYEQSGRRHIVRVYALVSSFQKGDKINTKNSIKEDSKLCGLKSVRDKIRGNWKG